MSDQTQIVEVEAMAIVKSDRVQLGMIELAPEEVIARGATIAKALAAVIKDRKLYTTIRGRDHVRVEGWTTLGAIVGIMPREREARLLTPEQSINGDPGYEAYVELVRVSDGQVIGGASAVCTRGESNWAERDEYAIRSMAITRATGKAFRLSLSWIMQLAGFDPTPAEEIPHEEPSTPIRQDPPVRQDWTSLFWELANRYELDKEQVNELLVNHGKNFHHAYEALKASLEPEPPQ